MCSNRVCITCVRAVFVSGYSLCHKLEEDRAEKVGEARLNVLHPLRLASVALVLAATRPASGEWKERGGRAPSAALQQKRVL